MEGRVEVVAVDEDPQDPRPNVRLDRSTASSCAALLLVGWIREAVDSVVTVATARN